ncbi:peroxidase family protein [Fuscovulum ytuae]|uniref:Peroxidase family protein n=1 Tax=Fuscovulum ytuae TaxID=3042299 RepID=A0ABY8Q5P7_9RHOB|nr:peroxidase family protein [Fuscovulum sp. YMD61]WGV15978.1 peroxidase family protein [Fuscovulum sp. YMD61]
MSLKPFVLNQTDLEFILAQLDFIPLFDANGDAIINWDGTGAVYNAAGVAIWDPAGAGSYAYDGVTLTSANVVDVLGHSFPTSTTLVGLREQAGFHNNLNAGEPTQEWGVSGATFIRLVPADFWNYVSGVDYTPGTTVTDATPRIISRTITTGGVVLLQDANGQIVYWSAERYQTDSAYAATIDGWNADPANADFLIDTAHQIDGAAIVVDRGLVGEIGQIDFQNPGNGEVFVASQNPGVAPTNGWFALFGQFFDHGLDFIDKSSAYGKVIIPLSVDDPLYRAPGTNGPADPGNTKITVSRAVIEGTDANGDPTYVNHTSPYIDQNQTYGSTEEIANILREWVIDPLTGEWVPGMNLLDGHSLADAWTDGWGNVTHATLPTLAELNEHLIATGRDALTWEDVTNLRSRDASGHVIAGNTGHPLLLDMNPKFDTAHFSVAVQEALAATFVKLAVDGRSMVVTSADDPDGHAILPGADGSYSTMDLSALINFASFQPMQSNADPMGALASQLLFDSVSAHYVAGDGRVNENFGLTAVHHVFHSEHNYQVENLLRALAKQDAALAADGDLSHATLHGFQIDTGETDAAGNFVYADGSIAWDQDKVFLGTKLIVEMEYQHTAADQFAPTITPDIPEYVGYNSGVNASISLEFGQVAYRFGHSTLRETVDTIDPSGSITGKIVSYALQLAFLNPEAYAEVGPGAIALGMTHQQAGDVDEFMTPALNQGLLGMPLDLAAINIARGRDVGIPTLNAMRTALGVQAYDSWASFAEGMGHKESLPAFIAAYAFGGDMAKAQELVDLANGTIASGSGPMGWTIGNAIAFMNNAFTAADTAISELVDAAAAVDFIDAWIGGLAEVHVTGGLLGETFNILFVDQIVRLKDGDRLYYLYRLVNQNFGDEIAGEQFKDIVERNTGTQHLNGNIFAYADQYYDFGRDADSVVTGVQDDIPNHAYGATLAANPDAGILSRGGAEASNGAVLDYIAPQIMAYSRENISIDGRTVTYSQAPALAGKYILDQRAEHDPGQTNIEGLPVTGAGSHEVMVGSAGNDVLYLEAGDDTAYGEEGDDLIIGGNGIDRLHGGAGNDTLIGGDMGDLIDGGDGDDVLVGGSSGTAAAGLNQLIGGQGDDVIYAGQGIDKISGGGGDDVIYGEGDTDAFTHGGDGCDYIDGGQSGDLLYGDNGDDVLVGGDDQDFLQGGMGDDIIRPGNPSQALAGFGPDEVIGGDGIIDTGFDLIDFSDYLSGSPAIVADMNTQNNPQAAIDKTTPFPAWFQMEGVIGSQKGDQVIGDANDNWLIGGSGDDLLQGGAGFDLLIGDAVRLDQLIGTYSGTYTMVDDISGATHRNTGILQDNGLLARADLGTTDFAKHFTEMLSSRMFKDYVLGNDGGASGGNDAAVYTGNRADYVIERVTLGAGDPALGAVWKVTGIGAAEADGADLLVGVERLVFADQELSLLGNAPVLQLHGFDALNFADTFSNGYNGSTGADAWAGAWSEANDGSGSSGNGGIQVSSRALQFGSSNDNRNVTTGATITRGVAGTDFADGATLRFTVSKSGSGSLEADDAVRVWFANDGVNFTEVDLIDRADASGVHEVALTGPFGANAALRFEKVGLNDRSEYIRIDDVALDMTGPAAVPTQDIAVSFTEGDNPIGIADLPSITDDGVTLQSGRVTLTNAKAGDTLRFGPLPAGITGVLDTATAGVITLLLSGGASLAAYEAAIQSVRFANSSDTPDVTDRIIETVVSDGFAESAPAVTTVAVTAVNDAPQAAGDAIITRVNGTFAVPDWVLMLNDSDVDGPQPLAITSVGNDDRATVSHAGQSVSITYTQTTRSGSFDYTVSDGLTTDSARVTINRDATGDLTGGSGAEILVGGDGAETIVGGRGNDVILAGGGDDLIRWSASNFSNSTDGFDVIDGGTEGTAGDTFEVNGNNSAESFEIVAVASYAGAVTPGTEIVILRNGSKIAELRDIEEIIVNTNGGGFGGADNDTVAIVGDFTGTSLFFNTITVNGSAGDDTVDISQLSSAHRIVFRTAGGNDHVVGALRAQDVVELPAGSDPAAFEASDNGDGTVTMSDGQRSVTFTGLMDALPELVCQTGTGEGGNGATDGGADLGNGGGSSEAEDAPSHDGLVLMPGDSASVQMGDAGDDVIVGGEEGDALLGKGGSDIILGNGGNDVAVGGSGGDVIEGGAGRDVLLGGEGDDLFVAQADDGADMIFGGAGSDTIDLSALTGGAVVDLGAYTPIGTVRVGGVTDHLVGIENATGGMGNDVIKASLSINVLTGGDGDDVFVFVSAGTADGDVITDFRPGDKIDLSGIDAMVGMNGNQAFTLADQGTTAAGSLVIREVATVDGVDTIIDGFTDDDDDADFSITLHGAHDLSGAFSF